MARIRRLIPQPIQHVPHDPAIHRLHTVIALGHADEILAGNQLPAVVVHTDQNFILRPHAGAAVQRDDLLATQQHAFFIRVAQASHTGCNLLLPGLVVCVERVYRETARALVTGRIERLFGGFQPFLGADQRGQFRRQTNIGI